MMPTRRTRRTRQTRDAFGWSEAPILATFRVAYSAAPAAVATASALLVALGVADMVLAPVAATAGIFMLVLVAMITLAVALGARSEPAFLASVLLIAGASAFADLPAHRGDAGVIAAIAGAAVLGIIEAGGAALEPSGGGERLGRPGRAHVAWVAMVAVGGAVAGWLLLSLQPDLADLGLVALAFGVLAAVGMIVFAGALTGSVLRDVGGVAGAGGGRAPGELSPPGRRAPSRRGRRRGRGTRPSPPDHPLRSTPSS
jgi:hypothetical protein